MKHTARLITATLTMILLASLLTGCLFAAVEKVFTKDGFSITLTNRFIEGEGEEYEGFDIVYDSRDIAVFCLKENFSDFVDGANLSPRTYGELVLQANQMDTALLTEGEQIYFEYQETIDGDDYSYLATVHKGADAFWLVQFACLTENYETLKPMMMQYAASVKV